uniref:Cytochrome c oxidase subunit 2 n=2 Tax=Ciona TaxID=7718 RepID=Q8HIN6_CIOIN|nr:cytochrome c oxidase subunit II [Ciona robusta]CAD56915.1 cytochrome oxidase subunit II [Ciona robusta]SBU37552.1 cytochrome oxidase subunit II [Ciona robusta]
MYPYSFIQLTDSNTFFGHEIVLFHDFSLASLVFILTAVLLMSKALKKKKYVVLAYKGSNMLEFLWTFFPVFILISIGLPSLYLMYLLEGSFKGDLTFKVVGHQWYWSYEGGDFNDFDMSSYMVPSEDLQEGQFRLLEVDNSMVLPYSTNIRLMITSYDVIHSWTLPSLKMKVDAVPGRLNTMNIFSFQPGSFYGQCSEICGLLHSFMPIHVEFVNWETFLNHVTEESFN